VLRAARRASLAQVVYGPRAKVVVGPAVRARRVAEVWQILEDAARQASVRSSRGKSAGLGSATTFAAGARAQVEKWDFEEADDPETVTVGRFASLAVNLSEQFFPPPVRALVASRAAALRSTRRAGEARSACVRWLVVALREASVVLLTRA